MNDVIFGVWRSLGPQSKKCIVLPDGCRDIIFRQRRASRPEWFVSPLFDAPTVITSHDQTKMVGFCLKPGAIINATELVNALQGLPPEKEVVAKVLLEMAVHNERVDEALGLLANCSSNVMAAAKQLGVSGRTLQRLVLSTTDRTPAYWLRLSRARKSARLVIAEQPLSVIAGDCGFSDQPHMNREFRHWFGATPTEFKKNAALIAMLKESGYGDD